MPLIAYSKAGARFPAWSMSPVEWDSLKTCYRELGLTASCCGAPVIPAVSKLGWCFYRHTPGTACEHVESPLHLVAKTIVARAAEALGLKATTEAQGVEGAWRADVLVEPPTGSWKGALEIQLSRCDLPAIEDRQDRYEAHGVRGAWLVGFNLPTYRPVASLPLFRLVLPQEEVLDPWIDNPPPHYAGPQLPLADFTKALLRRGVTLVDPPPDLQELSVCIGKNRCWRCHQDHDAVIGIVNAPVHVVFCPNGFLPVRDIGKLPDLWAAYRSAVPALMRLNPDLSIIRPARPPMDPTQLRSYCAFCEASTPIEKLPQTLGKPAEQRCYTLSGRQWMLSDRVQPHWAWQGGQDARPTR
ncbi:hypothetical protein [Azospirillum sp. SYSU D00513]|uniref:competence protein CoiA family protein n=1 Tax=Azospirillum sp. SYSU D00513 TaxID=2812561 RepID=UPI001A95A0D3|nr:hypothetical protein [Azospirillum sp. SYSU D00513]